MRLKTVFIGTAVVLVACGATAAAMLRSVDLGALRPLVAEEVQSATGRGLVLGGDVRLAVSLRPTIVFHHVALANAPWGSRPQMLKAQRLEAELDLLSALRGEIRIDRITLVGAELLLETDRKGRGNWIFDHAKAPEGAAPASPKAAGAAFVPTITVIRLENTMLRVRDGASGAVHAIRLRCLEAHFHGRSGPIAVALDGMIGAVPLALSGRLRFSRGSVALESFKARVGHSDLAGDVVVRPSGRRPRIEATVDSAVLDLADFGVAPVLGARSSTEPAGDRLFSADPLPFAALRRADITVRIKARRVRWRPLSFENAHLDAAVEHGRLEVRSFELGWQGGAVSAAFTLDASRPTSTLEGTITGRRIIFGRLLRALGLGGAMNGGVSDFDLEFRGRGENLRAIMAGLDGVVGLDIGAARIEGRSEALGLARSVGLIAVGEEAGRPNLHCAAGRVVIDEGLAVSRGLVIDSNSAIVIGEGQLDLGTEALDIRLHPHAKRVSLMSLGTPLVVGGTLLQPTVSADATPLAVGAAGAAAVLATGATGGLAAVVAALAAGGVAAAGTGVDDDEADRQRCIAILSSLQDDDRSSEAADPPRSNRRFRR